MSEDAKSILVLIPFPVMSHLVSAVETAKLLAGRDNRLAVTILVMKHSTDTMITSYIKNSPHPRISFVELKENESISGARDGILRFVESQKGAARAAVAEIKKSGRLAGFLLDMFCTPIIDVANELGAPAYIYFSSGSAFLGLLLHLQILHDKNGLDLKVYKERDGEVYIPSYVNPVPTRVWPAALFERQTSFLEFVRGYRDANGIVINTFLEFESHAINSLSTDEKLPQVYPVGPIIQGGGEGGEEEEEEESDRKKEIIGWLDNQPNSSVMFLCFGTRGCFERNQVEEIAAALEHSGLRFLWSLRKPPPEGSVEFPVEYENLEEILPEGFLERSFGVGKVIGWAPQTAVLSHPAVGGFVSHCGWNSILESIWCGVPMAAWPLEAEQHVNAFLLVEEFEVGVEIKMDYRSNSGVIVDANTIEKAMRQLMEPENKIRVTVKELQKKSRVARVEGGSSYNFLGRLIDNITDTVS